MNKFTQLLQKFFLINFISLFLFSGYLKANTENSIDLKNNLDQSYLNPKPKNDYILDTGDSIRIKFLYAPNLDGVFFVNKDGEIFLPKINYAYVRGLTINELQVLLEEKYKDILINSDLEIRIEDYKPVRIFVKGEVREPGVYTLRSLKKIPSDIDLNFVETNSEISFDLNSSNEINNTVNPDNLTGINIKGSNVYTVNLSNALFEAKGLTKYSDISNIEIIRDIPLGQGGGKKKAIIDLTSFLNNFDPSSDIKLFDGDSIYVPKLKEPNPDLVPKTVLTRISPKFITVDVLGRIEDTGRKSIPLESTLSDVMDLFGPVKPLSGKIVLIRFTADGRYTKKSIKYSRRAPAGSSKNPYLNQNDIISVRESVLGKSTKIIKEITEPFLGIYTTKEVIEGFGE